MGIGERPRTQGELPAEVHDLLVASLFKDQRTLVLGAATTAIGIAVTAGRTGAWSLWACTGALAVVVALRLWLMRAYARHVAADQPTSRTARWERAYGIGAAIHCVVIGIWCLLCLTATTDVFAQLLSAVITVGCASAIPGRNFGRTGIATVQILGLCLPLCLGWVLKGDLWYAALALLSLPFFASLRIMSGRLQGTLLEALTANNKLGTLAERFDAALTNMPLGICMLDRRGRVQVFNARFTAILGLGRDLTDAALPALLPPPVARDGSALPALAPETGIASLLAACAGGEVVLDLADGRTVELTVQPMANGGAVVLAEDVTRRRQAEAHIVRLARIDTVTEIANRAYFLQQAAERFDAARGGGTTCALHFIDLDRFKMVNDTLGHVAGDMLLRDVARRLSRLIGPSDIVGRFGGDEFVILQTALARQDDAAELADALVGELARPFAIAGHPVRIAASIGVIVGAGRTADLDLMLQQADVALYRAKAAGRGRWTLFEAGMDAAVLQRHMLEMELATALETWAFELYYQPLFQLDAMRIGTCEALLRWKHPVHGMIPPSDFIPIAEETGMIAELGARVLETACTECQGWPAPMNVAVNLSPVQFQRGDIVAVIRHALQLSGLRPDRLEVEITESTLLQNTADTLAALEQIRALGVQIVLDDFGTGHSSLSYLHNFPLQKVKLDRSFLIDVGQNRRSRLVLDGVCGLSRKLGLTVVVEGVETEAQLELVRGLDSVDEVQGFLMGRPVPCREIGALLRRARDAASDAMPGAIAAE